MDICAKTLGFKPIFKETLNIYACVKNLNQRQNFSEDMNECTPECFSALSTGPHFIHAQSSYTGSSTQRLVFRASISAATYWWKMVVAVIQ